MNRIHARTVKPQLEALEARQLLTMSVTLGGNGTLFLTGTDRGDYVHVDSDGYAITVKYATQGDQVWSHKSYDTHRVFAIVFNGYGGNDLFENNTHTSSTAYGGANDDVLLGGYGDDVFYGGSGTDWLLGAAGNDTLVGGRGSDYLFGGDGADWLYGGSVESDYLIGGNYDNGHPTISDGARDILYVKRNQDRYYFENVDSLRYSS
jgi:Ca2+-binding RTX toxin-like protein